MRTFFRWWNAYLRRIDLLILWPVCKREARKHEPDDEDLAVDIAAAAFMVHAARDPAWSDLSDHEINMIVARLT